MTGVTTASVRLNHFLFGPLVLVTQGVHCINPGFVICLIYIYIYIYDVFRSAMVACFSAKLSGLEHCDICVSFVAAVPFVLSLD